MPHLYFIFRIERELDEAGASLNVNLFASVIIRLKTGIIVLYDLKFLSICSILFFLCFPNDMDLRYVFSVSLFF